MSISTTEINIMREQMLAMSKDRRIRVFRNNTGTAWQGQKIVFPGLPKNMIALQDFRPIHFGLCNGSSDIIGLKSVEITQDMVGKRVAVFVAVESKTKTGKPTAEQEAFIRMVNDSGGLAGVARSADEALTIVG